MGTGFLDVVIPRRALGNARIPRSRPSHLQHAGASLTSVQTQYYVVPPTAGRTVPLPGGGYMGPSAFAPPVVMPAAPVRYLPSGHPLTAPVGTLAGCCVRGLPAQTYAAAPAYGSARLPAVPGGTLMYGVPRAGTGQIIDGATSPVLSGSSRVTRGHERLIANHAALRGPAGTVAPRRLLAGAPGVHSIGSLGRAVGTLDRRNPIVAPHALSVGMRAGTRRLSR